jgi:Bacterial Ig-like domain
VNEPPDPAHPIQFGIYRSSDGQFSSSDTLVSTFTLVATGAAPGQAATLDQNDLPAAGLGSHQLTIPLAGGLPPYPQKPYVIVVANPSSPSASTAPDQTASFRTYTIGVVTHGGIQNTSWKHGPPWELQIAYEMRHEGYDAVIAYNWALQSNTPGAAIRQSPRLERSILHAASQFPADAPVNLDFIGHSEGTVVNSYAIALLQDNMTPSLKAGYIVDTILDPHAANNNVPGKQYSTAGPLAALANVEISNYQGEARDPPAYVPSIVDQAQVFYQHSAATAGEIYNLWGQVPVRSQGPIVHYYNLTSMGTTHSGKTGVALWYRNFIVPTLGFQAPLVQELQLNGQIDDSAPMTASMTTADSRLPLARHTEEARASRILGPAQVVQTNQPSFSGTAAPDSVVRLYIGPGATPTQLALAGRTKTNALGQWSLSTRQPLPNGQYRVVVTAFAQDLRTRPGLTIVPTQPMGRLVIGAPGSRIA